MTGFYCRRGKRVVDVVGAGAAMLMLVGTAIAVRGKLGKPVLFVQERRGLNGSSFRLVKFRTLTDDPDADGNLLPSAQRFTSLVRRMRALSLDELPGLFNVLKGDMSLVGPRPLVAIHLPRCTPRQARRHEPSPGLTGWVQVNGRNALDWEAKFELDVCYVVNASFAVDVRILWKTVFAVLNRQGITSRDHATMEEFIGTLTESDEQELPPPS